MNLKAEFFIVALFFIVSNLHAQNIGMNNNGAIPDPSAMLDISATDKGLLIPRIFIDSMGDRSAIASPARSLLIFNTNHSFANGLSGSGFYFNSGTTTSPQWLKLTTENDGWSLNGNTGTNTAHFLGTTDSIDFNIRTNNKQHFRFKADGRVELGGAGLDYVFNGGSPTLPKLKVSSDDDNNNIVFQAFNNNGNSPSLYFGSARGTSTTPLALFTGQELGNIRFSVLMVQNFYLQPK